MWSLSTLIFVWFSVNEISAGVTKRRSQNRPNVCDASSSKSNLNSFLWTLKRDDGPPSYFFGTIHVPYTRVWDYIPDNVMAAFKQSDNIFFELDLTDPYTMKALANCQLLPHGENLSNILPEDIYTRLKDHLQYVREKMPNWLTADQKGKGLYGDYLFNVIAGNWERKRPIWVMLLVNSLTESDIKSREIPVLDLYLAQEAERHRKITGAVEKVEEQCVPLNDLNFSQNLVNSLQPTDDIFHLAADDLKKVLFALNRTLWQHESYRLSDSAIPYTTDDLIYHYNCGDLNDIIFSKDTRQVPNLLNASLPPSDLKTAKLLDNYFKTELINKRNERMAGRVANLLNDHPDESFFFAFGAGHFLGNNTVVDRLIDLGFDIQHTPASEEIPLSNFANQEWRDQKSPHLTNKSTSYPLSANIFSGDIEYFVYNRLRLHKRQKKRKNKIQEDFGDYWDQIDEETRSWIEQTRRDRIRKYNSNKPFNDLWIRMETPRPNAMQEKSDTDRTTAHYIPYLQNAVPSITLSNTLMFTLLCIWTLLSGSSS